MIPVNRRTTVPSAALAVSEKFDVVPAVTDNINIVVGRNLRRLRTQRGLSLDRLSQASSVSRAMLGQIELGRSIPTVNLLWKIAKGLDVPINVLFANSEREEFTILRAHRAKWLSSGNGRFVSRALFPLDAPRKEEFYEVRIAAQTIEEDLAHAPGTVEHLVVTKGTLEILIDKDWTRLEKGDTIIFPADRPHAYRNPSIEEAIFFMLRVHAKTGAAAG